MRRLDARQLVFVDECGTHTSMTRRYARAPKGERAYGSVPRNRAKNTTLLASMGVEGMGECLVVEGATTKDIYRGLRRAGLSACALAGADCRDGQSHRPQGLWGARACRGRGL